MTAHEVWPAGRPLIRALPHDFGSTEFDDRRDVDARFSPLFIDGTTTPPACSTVTP